jgi:hypothetical protein
MPEWAQFKKEYCLEPWHLPIPHGPNVCVIEALDSEEAIDSETNEPYVRHLLILAGWTLPLRLRNDLIDNLQAMFGPRSEDAIGRKICLITGTRLLWGKTTACINIMPVVPPAESRPVQPISRLRVVSKQRLEIASGYGVPLFADAPRPALNLSPMGEEAAVRLRKALAEHGKNWENVLVYIKRVAPDLVAPCIGVELSELPMSAKKYIGEYFASLSPAAPPPSSSTAHQPDTQSVDRVTGEVIDAPGPRTDPTSIPGVQRGVDGLRTPAIEPVATKAAANANAKPAEDDDSNIPF